MSLEVRDTSGERSPLPQLLARAALRRLAIALGVAASVAACSNAPPVTTPMPGGIDAIPDQLAYLCVSPGCQETQTVEFDVHGDRRVAILRVLLSGGGAPDFSITPSEAPPFIVGTGSSFTVDVTYTPLGAPAPGDVELLVTYTDASPDDSPDRLQPGQVSVPLVRRIVGEPLLVVAPSALQFGVVDAGSTKSLNVHVSNQGFGNLVLEIASVDAGQSNFTAVLPASTAMAPDSGFDLPIVFAPTSEAYVNAQVEIVPSATDVAPGFVMVEGTSLNYAKLGMEPSGDLDFGLIAKGNMRTFDRKLVNQGGVPLIISAINLSNGLGCGAAADGGAGPGCVVTVPAPMLDGGMVILAPLSRTPFTVLINGTTAGDVDSMLTLSSNDPTTPSYPLHITGTVTDPKIQLTPGNLDFGIVLPDGGPGKVPVGWVVTRALTIENVGYGPLTVTNITMVSGSAMQFTLDDVPTLPFTLDRNARAGVNIEFRAETALNFMGTLSVENNSDGIDTFSTATLNATVGTCQESCPIAHGTPDCGSSMSCNVGMCNPGWYDADGLASTGCECAKLGTAGGFCMTADNIGSFDNSTATYTGNLPTMGDTDVLRAWESQAGCFLGFFCDTLHFHVRLDTSDPGISMCVYHHSGGHDASACFLTDMVCPADGNYEYDTSDDADFTIEVTRSMSSTPSCSSYSVFISQDH